MLVVAHVQPARGRDAELGRQRGPEQVLVLAHAGFAGNAPFAGKGGNGVRQDGLQGRRVEVHVRQRDQGRLQWQSGQCFDRAVAGTQLLFLQRDLQPLERLDRQPRGAGQGFQRRIDRIQRSVTMRLCTGLALGACTQFGEIGNLQLRPCPVREIGACALRGQERSQHQRIEDIDRYLFGLYRRDAQPRFQWGIEVPAPVAQAFGCWRALGMAGNDCRDPALVAYQRHQDAFHGVLQGAVGLAVLLREVIQP